MLAVTGMGMISALGSDVVTSCAAARAGLIRAAPVEGTFTVDPEADAMVPVTGHEVRLVRGLFGSARLLQLFLAALADFKRGFEPASPRPVGFILVTRSDLHRSVWLERLQKDPELLPDEFDLEAAQQDLATQRQRLMAQLPGQMVEGGKLQVERAAQRVIAGDQCGFVGALDQAERWLGAGQCQTVLIASVDSYLDPETIAALQGLGMLKSPENPVGCLPGELASVIAVEEGRGARRDRRPMMATIEAFAQVPGARSRTGGDPPVVEPLLKAMAGAGGQDGGLAVVNLNGDNVRALEWGTALVTRRARGLREEIATWIPPLHFGEIGAATGAAAVAMLARGWARRYAPAPRALVSLIEDGTTRAAFSVTTPLTT